MIHIGRSGRLTDSDGGTQIVSYPFCCAQVTGADTYVDAAFESDCNACRTAVGVARVGDKSYHGAQFGVSPTKKWEPEPHPRADEIVEHVRKSREM